MSVRKQRLRLVKQYSVMLLVDSVAGDIFPLVKIDVKKGLLYHLSQKSSEGEIEHAEFETKSV